MSRSPTNGAPDNQPGDQAGKQARRAARKTACPSCGAAVTWSDAFPDRPFCSERCRLLDLGAWASDNYRIPSQEPVDEDLIGNAALAGDPNDPGHRT